MDNLAEYLDLIVEPTFTDFRQNPRSGRHAFLACVATFHALDRVKRVHTRPHSLRQVWQRESIDFLIVDMVAHHLKHVQSGHEREPPPKDAIPLPSIVFDQHLGDPEALGLDLHNLQYVIRDAIRFIRHQL